MKEGDAIGDARDGLRHGSRGGLWATGIVSLFPRGRRERFWASEQVLRGIILANRRILLGVGRAGTRAKLGDKGSNPGGEKLGRLVNRGVGRPTWLAGALWKGCSRSGSADGLEVDRVRAALGGLPPMLAVAVGALALWLDWVLHVGHPSVPRK